MPRPGFGARNGIVHLLSHDELIKCMNKHESLALKSPLKDDIYTCQFLLDDSMLSKCYLPAEDYKNATWRIDDGGIVN